MSEAEIGAANTDIGGRCFVYVWSCAWEDHCKVGFSRDPLRRLQALHRRWFEFFDLDHAGLVETETVRDARNLELELRRPLIAHRAPAPMTVRHEAGGHTEWLRGASSLLEQSVAALVQRGYVVHVPVRHWLRARMLAASDPLYSWTLVQLSPEELSGFSGPTHTQRLVRDTLDAYVALDIALQPLLPPEVHRWYCGRGGADAEIEEDGM